MIARPYAWCPARFGWLPSCQMKLETGVLDLHQESLPNMWMDNPALAILQPRNGPTSPRRDRIMLLAAMAMNPGWVRAQRKAVAAMMDQADANQPQEGDA